jgi:hypothetical protein
MTIPPKYEGQQRAIDEYGNRTLKIKKITRLILGMNNYPPPENTIYISLQQENRLRCCLVNAILGHTLQLQLENSA